MSGLNNTLKREFKDKESADAYVNEFLNTSIATQIKVLREQRDWTQKELASTTGMEQSRISLLENINNTMWSISTLKKLAEAFDVTLNVSFETFSDRIKDIDNFSRESLERLSRMDDLLSAVPDVTDNQVSSDKIRLVIHAGSSFKKADVAIIGTEPKNISLARPDKTMQIASGWQ